MWLPLWRARRLPLNCETPYATLKRHFSQMICLLLLLQPRPPVTCVCVCVWVFFHVSPSKCLLCPPSPPPSLPHFYRYHPNPPTYKPPFYPRTKAAMFVFVSRLLSLVPLMFWQSPQPPCSHILTTSLQSSPRLQ